MHLNNDKDNWISSKFENIKNINNFDICVIIINSNLKSDFT